MIQFNILSNLEEMSITSPWFMTIAIMITNFNNLIGNLHSASEFFKIIYNKNFYFFFFT